MPPWEPQFRGPLLKPVHNSTCPCYHHAKWRCPTNDLRGTANFLRGARKLGISQRSPGVESHRSPRYNGVSFCSERVRGLPIERPRPGGSRPNHCHDSIPRFFSHRALVYRGSFAFSGQFASSWELRACLYSTKWTRRIISTWFTNSREGTGPAKVSRPRTAKPPGLRLCMVPTNFWCRRRKSPKVFIPLPPGRCH